MPDPENVPMCHPGQVVTVLLASLVGGPLRATAPDTAPASRPVTTGTSQPAALGQGHHRRTVKVDGLTRSYRVHVPRGYDAGKPTPVVLILHGAWTNAAVMAGFCGLNAKADSAGFLAVYPNGWGATDGITKKVYGPGKGGAEVVLYVVHGAGHTWPGRKPPVAFLGKSTMDISANDLIWEFFEKHPLPASATRSGATRGTPAHPGSRNGP